MRKTLCYSVRLESMIQITPKAYKAVAYDGSEAIIPASQYFGQDFEVQKSEAHWIAAWILEKKGLQYSDKKKAYFDELGHKKPYIQVEHHTATKVEPKEDNEINELQR